MQHVFHEPEENSFNRVGIVGKVFPTAELGGRAGFVLVETKSGHETAIIEHECDFVYYVLKGSGSFIVNDIEETCSEGDLVAIPKGTKFTYKGKLKMLLATTPAWFAEQEETLLLSEQ